MIMLIILIILLILVLMKYLDELNKQMDTYNNIPNIVKNKIDENLHMKPSHPIKMVIDLLKLYFKGLSEYNFKIYDSLSPIVSTKHNFDDLLIKPDHPSRKKTDTYYVNHTTVLRTHMTAHQPSLLPNGDFLAIGPVYRKDEADKNHFYVFHQIDGVGFVKDDQDPLVELKKILSGLVEFLFPNCEYRFNDDTFPFTHSSLEVEVMYNGSWLEILGCGVTQQEILDNLQVKGKCWAFGIGIERLCMLFFNIPDIRYFWSTDDKFLSQFNETNFIENFKNNTIPKFQPYSNLNSITKDISFYLNNDDVIVIGTKVLKNIKKNKVNEIEVVDFKWNLLNDFCDWVRENGNDLLESITLDDDYCNKENKYSNTYRITFSPTSDIKDPSILTYEANKCMDYLRNNINNKFNVELR